MSEIEKFNAEVQQNVRRQGLSSEMKQLGLDFVVKTAPLKYSYNFQWMGRPIIQFPQDMIAMQEIIWKVRPDIIIETGIAHGGSLIYYASLCELIGNGKVIGIDIDIRTHNKSEIESHPMSKRIDMIQGSSIDPLVISQVNAAIKKTDTVMVILDSNHTHDHVLKELQLYTKLVTMDSYCIVFDTVIEDMPDDSFPDRPWSKGNNPKTAVYEFLDENNNFVIDSFVHNKLLISVAPDGFLKRVK